MVPSDMIVAIIQARMSSTRLANKVLMDLAGKPMLAHIVGRTKASKVDKVVVATTVEPSDDELVTYLNGSGLCQVFRGSEEDVLERFFLCAREHAGDTIVRVTADDPLKDPEIINRALQKLADDPSLDYCSNTLRPTFPEGLDIEAFRFSALERAYHDAELASEREHVTPYIWKNPDRFKILNFEHEEDLSDWRWTVDKPEDMAFMRAIYEALGRDDPLFSYTTTIEYLKRHPELMSINAGTVRNEGYLKSLQDE